MKTTNHQKAKTKLSNDSPVSLYNQKSTDQHNDSNNSKVCQRASSLKIYALVMLAFGILALVAAITVFAFLGHWSPHTQQNSLTVLGMLILLFITLPALIFATIFLSSRNPKLVRTMLAVILIFYLLSILSSLLTLFKAHNANTSVGFIPLIIDGGLAYWTYNVFSRG